VQCSGPQSHTGPLKKKDARKRGGRRTHTTRASPVNTPQKKPRSGQERERATDGRPPARQEAVTCTRLGGGTPHEGWGRTKQHPVRGSRGGGGGGRERRLRWRWRSAAPRVAVAVTRGGRWIRGGTRRARPGAAGPVLPPRDKDQRDKGQHSRGTSGADAPTEASGQPPPQSGSSSCGPSWHSAAAGRRRQSCSRAAGHQGAGRQLVVDGRMGGRGAGPGLG